jgi:hypothetical protein
MTLLIVILMGVGFYVGFRFGNKYATLKDMWNGIKLWIINLLHQI